MRLPEKKKPGDPVLAADWNLLLEAIEARTPRSGAGLELVSSSGGFAYSAPSPKGELGHLPPYGAQTGRHPYWMKIEGNGWKWR
ncbi:MAG: hypothetical protein NTV46_10460 [Verrucomicrobia bacterium]|nr:hypothetical protein [Verrucomicrobiota bacterium]